MTIINVVGEFRKSYIKNRLNKNQEDAKATALHAVQMHLLRASAAHYIPVLKKDLDILKDIEKNPHYTQLLEDILTIPEDQQREYLRNVANVPKLRLIQ